MSEPKFDLAGTIAALPGGWGLSQIVRHRDGTPRRFVATRSFVELDDDGVPCPEPTRQFESWVDAEDLVEGIHRRNVALGIEKRASREEVAQSA